MKKIILALVLINTICAFSDDVISISVDEVVQEQTTQLKQFVKSTQEKDCNKFKTPNKYKDIYQSFPIEISDQEKDTLICESSKSLYEHINKPNLEKVELT